MKTIKINNLVNNLVVVVTDKAETIEEITQKVTSVLLKILDSAEEIKDGAPRSQQMPQSTSSSKKSGANTVNDNRAK